VLNWIDGFLNKITMYRLVLYYLIFLWAVALIFGFFGILPYDPGTFALSALIIISACWVTNFVFARVFRAQANIESLYITGFILALIITPVKSTDLSGLAFLVWVGIWAMASKYILAIGKKHLLNPAAFAVALAAFTIGQSASWWVGTLPMSPFVVLGGLIVARKLQRFDLVLSFFAVSLATIVGTTLIKGADAFSIIGKSLFDSPILFFAFVMITEPLTTPPTRLLRVIYGAMVGFLFAPAMHLGSLYSTPELALIVGNIFSYFVSPRGKYVMRLVGKTQIAEDTYDFVFVPDRKISFRPGQYLEWTLGHSHADNRGNRRYFTIASSPTEDSIRLGIKFYPEASSFKRMFLKMKPGSEIVAGQLAGEFTLPRNKNKKLVFIAGGIGITPFRSMIKHLLNNNEKREIILLYSNKIAADIAYADIFDEASQKLGIRSVYTLTAGVPTSWPGRVGPITEQVIQEEIPDYKERIFYVSGPHSMVAAFERTLKNLGLKKRQIKIDFFPGFV